MNWHNLEAVLERRVHIYGSFFRFTVSIPKRRRVRILQVITLPKMARESILRGRTAIQGTPFIRPCTRYRVRRTFLRRVVDMSHPLVNCGVLGFTVMAAGAGQIGNVCGFAAFVLDYCGVAGGVFAEFEPGHFCYGVCGAVYCGVYGR